MIILLLKRTTALLSHINYDDIRRISAFSFLLILCVLVIIHSNQFPTSLSHLVIYNFVCKEFIKSNGEVALSCKQNTSVKKKNAHFLVWRSTIITLSTAAYYVPTLVNSLNESHSPLNHPCREIIACFLLSYSHFSPLFQEHCYSVIATCHVSFWVIYHHSPSQQTEPIRFYLQK